MNGLDLRFRKHRVRVGDNKDHALHVMRGRLVLFQAIALVGFAFMGLRAADLMVLQAADPITLPSFEQDVVLPEIADNAQKKDMRRADIVDRNGVLMATSLKTDSLYADPAEIMDKPRTAAKLAEIFPEYSAAALLDKLNMPRRFVWIKRGVTPDEQQAILDIGEPALAYYKEDYRFYPQGNETSHVVGMINRDGAGTLGLERGANELLTSYTADEVAEGAAVLKTTIDVRVQHVLHREIAKSIKDFDAKAGAGIIMDVDTGEILGAVSLPDFDPNNPPNPNAPEMFNRFSQGVYELGSTFKLFSTAAYFEFEKAPMSQRFDVRKPISHGRFKINDYHAEKRILTLPEVFMLSSNIGSARMGEAVGGENLQSFYRDLGLMDKPEFDLKEVTHPLVPNPWREINTLTTSYGHGIAVSPLQLIRAAGSIVNGGNLVSPRLTFAEVKDYQSLVRVVSERTAQNMRSLLRLTVTDGTGGSAEVEGLLIGGKTGTAEKPSKDGRGYDRKRLISSFLGVFPIDAPRYVIFIMVDEPKGQKDSFGYATAGWVAAPAVGKIIEAMAPMVGIKRRENAAAIDPATRLKRYINLNLKGQH
jgi:cell division protein FtsI (penicillin-binding protein 3)